VLVKSPGVPGEAPLVAAARARGIPIWSEIELASRLLPNPILGVTGTNGKTTTAALLGVIFEAAERDVTVAGNIGIPLTSVREADWVVCELSSFQLEDVETLRPPVAVLLNLEPDHLDRHGTLDAYRESKLRIFENQTGEDVAVVPRGFGPVPGAARRVEFAADDALPAEPLSVDLGYASVPFLIATTLERAVAEAASAATPGDVVLLSPACASYDQFVDFEARGDAFRSLVEELA